MSEGEKLARSFVDAYSQRDLNTAMGLFADEGMNFTVDDTVPCWSETTVSSQQSGGRRSQTGWKLR
jgi:hypothetical protein